MVGPQFSIGLLSGFLYLLPVSAWVLQCTPNSQKHDSMWIGYNKLPLDGKCCENTRV